MKLRFLGLLALPLWIGIAMGQDCRSYSFTGELRPGQGGFRQAIGGGLLLEMEDMKNGGWFVTLYPETQAKKQEKDDYIYPVNPPIRFNSLQYLGAAYGENAEDQIKREKDLHFALSKADYDHISALITDALWPYNAKDPDHAIDNYVTGLSNMKLGNIHYKPINYRFTGGKPEWLRFQIAITAPADFAFPPMVDPTAAPCPKFQL
jgi:hypothetical protein